jgi:hypothetical protein
MYQEDARVVIHCVISALREAEVGSVQVQGQPGLHSWILPQKLKKKKKWVGRIAQEVEPMSSKCEALNSNPTNAKKIGEKKKKRMHCPARVWAMVRQMGALGHTETNQSVPLAPTLDF